MALVTVQRSPSPSNTAESEEVDTEDGSNLKSPNRSRRSKSALKRLKKLFHTVRFISKLKPCFSESYFTVKGAALILPQNDVESTYTKKICKSSHGDIQSHLESMIALLRRQDTIALAVKLEVNSPDRHKYMAVVSCIGKQDTEESVILGVDFDEENKATIGLVLPVWADTHIALDGDGGFSITSAGNRLVFKPVTVQVMWFTLQSLNKLVAIARDNKYIATGLSHTWISFYESSINSDIRRINDWHFTEDLLFFKAEPVLLPTDDDEIAFLKTVRAELKNVMMKEDLDEATSKYLRTKLEEQMNMKLDKWKSYIDQEMLTILGQMDSPTLIKDYLYLGSEWNASNIEELTHNKVHHIMNISREIDNFFPGILHYYNIKEWDCEETDLLKHWENTHRIISKVREKNGRILVHCKMGISRSASTVIAYLMKEYNMSRQSAFDYVKDKRSCIMPNKAFWHQLETYEGILSASNQRRFFKQRSEVSLTDKVKEEKDEGMTSDNFLDVYQEQIWNKGLDESYPDVFLKEISDSCSYDFDNEIASSSRSADSNEEFYPDLPSPQPDGATGGKDFPADDSNDSESSEDEEVTIPTENISKSPPLLKITSATPTVPKKVLSKSDEADVNIGDSNKSLTEDLNPQSDLDLAQIEGDSSSEFEKSRGITPKSDIGIHQHYLKENIPWSAGTVKKTKADIEGKVRDVSSWSEEKIHFTPTYSKEVLKSSKDKELSSEESVGISEAIQILVKDETKSEKLFQPIDGVTETDTNLDTNIDNVLNVDNKNIKRPASVYEIEDIPLQPGLVRKTTQEIEERNRSTNDSPPFMNNPLQRSSSFKTERETPKKKRRNSERRKTITPILSPSSSCDASPTKDCTSVDSEQIDPDSKNSPENKKEENTKPEHISTDDKSYKSEVSSEEVSKSEETKEQDVAVYKFLGEEVPVEKGIVRKQKMGIELMNRERLSSENEKIENGNRSRKTSDNEGTCSSPTDVIKVQKEMKNLESPNGSSKQSVGESLVENIYDSLHTKNRDTFESVKDDNCGIEEKSPLFSEAKENFERASAKNRESEAALLHTPKSKKKAESRFDAVTLELIREIGSAILNSPAKSEVEDYEEEPAQLGSGLVRHYVRNIEQQTKDLKKKKTKKIIIIDKESQEKKRPWRWSSPTDQKSDALLAAGEQGKNEATKTPLKQSISSPILSSRHLLQSAKRFSESDYSPDTSSSPEKSEDISKSPPKMALGASCAVNLFSYPSKQKPSDSKDNEPDFDEETLDFKRLVGKYEGTQPLSLCSPENSKSLSDIKEVNSCESLKSVGVDETKDQTRSQSDSNSSISRQSDSEELFNEDCVKLRKIRNQLRKASLHTHRPKSIEIVRRNSATPTLGWCGSEEKSEENQSAFTWEGRKVRKLQGKSHPLTKLEWRRKFYNTM